MTTKERQHCGEWLVLDENGQLYAIGETLYTGVSPNNADVITRKLVVPLVAEVREIRTERREVLRYHQNAYDVWVKPVLGGRDGALIAVLACYVAVGTEFPPAPPVATWEWEEPAPGNGEMIRHWWGEDAPRLYGISAPDEDWHGGASGLDPYRFMDAILTEDSRVATTAIMQDFRNADVGVPLIKFMEQWHLASGQRQGVRAVGRKKAEHLYAGFSMKVDLDILRRALPGGFVRQLSAYAAIITDPLIIVDVVYDAVVMTSDDYPARKIPVPGNSSLLSMTHPDDITELRQVLRGAATHPGKRNKPVSARLRTADGTWHEFRFHAAGITDGAAPGNQYVMCRLEATGFTRPA